MAEKVHLNIAMVAGSMPPMRCGVGDNALALARTLAARGHRITIYTHQDADPLEEHHLTVRPLAHSWSWAGCHALTQALVLDDPDLIQIEYPTAGYGRATGPALMPMFLRLRRFKGPIITRLHEFGRAHWLRRLAIWPLLNDSDGILVPHEAMRRELIFRHRSLNDRPLTPVPVGASLDPHALPASTPESWAAQLQAWGVPEDAYPVLLSFGFVRKDKGLELLADAIAQIQKQSQAHVVHIGPFKPADDPQQEAVLDAISQRIVMDRFHFPGWQPLSVLPAAPPKGTLAVFPYTDGVSDRRSAAITLGLLGYPLLTTTPADAAEAEVWSTLAAKLVAPDQAAALTEALRGFLAADAIPTGQPERFAARYSWEVLAPQVEAFYEDVLERYRTLTDPGYYPAAAAAQAAHSAGHH